MASYPDPYDFQGPFIPTDYDLILIGGVLGTEMLQHGQPTAGTELEIDEQKHMGRDWQHMVAKGYRIVPTQFSLLLLKDLKTGINYLERYGQKVREQLMPQAVIKRENAIEIYHPMLSGDRITAFVVKSRSTPEYIGKQMWVVKVKGFDVRDELTKAQKTSKTTAVVYSPPPTAYGVIGFSSTDGTTKVVDGLTGQVITGEFGPLFGGVGPFTASQAQSSVGATQSLDPPKLTPGSALVGQP